MYDNTPEFAPFRAHNYEIENDDISSDDESTTTLEVKHNKYNSNSINLHLRKPFLLSSSSPSHYSSFINYKNNSNCNSNNSNSNNSNCSLENSNRAEDKSSAEVAYDQLYNINNPPPSPNTDNLSDVYEKKKPHINCNNNNNDSTNSSYIDSTNIETSLRKVLISQHRLMALQKININRKRRERERERRQLLLDCITNSPTKSLEDGMKNLSIDKRRISYKPLRHRGSSASSSLSFSSSPSSSSSSSSSPASGSPLVIGKKWLYKKCPM